MTVRRIAPGIPRILTKIIVKKFRPIWKLKIFPIRLIIRIIAAPIKEFNKSLNIIFNGTINILQRTKIIHKPDIYVKILISSNF